MLSREIYASKLDCIYILWYVYITCIDPTEPNGLKGDYKWVDI